MDFKIKKKVGGASKKAVGVDIGTSAIKIVEVESSAEKSLLTRIGIKPLPDSSRKTVTESLRSLIDEIKISSKDVNISVSGPSVIVRFVTMPKMKDAELQSAIKFEAEKYIPFAISDCVVDYQILKKNERENKLDMLLVAVKKELIMERIAIVEDGGLSVNCVDVDTFALANIFLQNFSAQEQDKAAALLNIGSSMTNVSIVRGGTLCFSRDVAIGGADFTTAISKGLGIDAASAEKIKISSGTKLQEVINATKIMAGNLVDEMRLSFSYYENKSGRGVDELYISGGGSGMAGLDTAFHEAFESKPTFWNPLQFLGIPKTSESAHLHLAESMNRSFAVAAGLAIR